MRAPLIGAVLAWAQRLRFPQLLALIVGLLIVDLLVPDPLPVLVELVLGLLALVISQIRRPEN